MNLGEMGAMNLVILPVLLIDTKSKMVIQKCAYKYLPFIYEKLVMPKELEEVLLNLTSSADHRSTLCAIFDG